MTYWSQRALAPSSTRIEDSRTQSVVRPTDFPRILVFDLTARGDGTATGEIKFNYFADWPVENYLQVFFKGGDRLGLIKNGVTSQFFELNTYNALSAIVEDFDPQVILYRPVPDASALHRFAMDTIKTRQEVPLITWVMDDWPARLEVDDQVQFATFNLDWLWLLKHSVRRLSICDQMSSAFKTRYGYEFEAFANGVDPSDWPDRVRNSSDGFVIRYAGALADNMTACSIQRVAEAVENIATDGTDIRLEIKTRPLWKNRQAANFRALKHTHFKTDELSASDYKVWLAGGDAVLIGYNFDADSLRYISLSMANKLPECLASGVPLIAHGPSETATIAYLNGKSCAFVIDTPDVAVVMAGIQKLMLSAEIRESLVAHARTVAFSDHDIHVIRRRFTAVVEEAAREKRSNMNTGNVISRNEQNLGEYSRDSHVRVDETEVVAHLLGNRTGPGRVMLDVGAHFGTSAAYFDNLGWTVHCFEPDPINRQKLVKRFGTHNNVLIDPRAVSDRPAQGVSFFRSEESTGISGLHAFRDTHREDGKVDVTTVGEIITQRRIHHVDFLKIDVEGFDFSVLKGVPWDQVRPDVIECEFEDYKTVPLGHTYKDVALYLREKGYAVYLSEWHPILRYGIQHDWRRLVPFPGEELLSDSWGNIVAFREDPGVDSVSEAFRVIIEKKNPQKAGNTKTSVLTSASVVNGSADRRPLTQPKPITYMSSHSSYERFVLWARGNSLVVNRAGQFAMWCLRKAHRHKVASSVLALAIAMLVVCGFAFPVWSIMAWAAAASLAMAAGLMALIGFVQFIFRRGIEHQISVSAKAIRDGLANEIRASRQAITQSRTEIEQAFASRANSIDVQIQTLHGMSDEHFSAAEKLAEKLSQLEKVQPATNAKAEEALATTATVAELVKSAAVFNMSRFQAFNRTLNEAQIAILISDWAKPLGLDLDSKRVGYLAHRACLLENMMKGRIATSVETIVLRSLIASGTKRGDVSILEIGTLFGIGAAAMYEAAANESDSVHITVIDPLDGYYGTNNRDLLTGAKISEATLRQNWSLAPIPTADFTIIKHMSSDPAALKEARKRSYDILVIDGDHSYEGVKFDFDHYFDLVRPGGYILFDDYDVADWPEIKRYVDSEIEGLPQLSRIGAGFRTAVYQVKNNRPKAKTGQGNDRN